MNRRAPIVVTVLAASAVALAGAPVGAPAKSSEIEAASVKPQAAARLVECSHGKAPRNRWAVFSGEMAKLDSADRMQMRFRLRERVGRDGWRGISAPGLDVWREARPEVLRFRYRQRINALRKGTAYRVDVSFRWLTTDGELVAGAEERSKPCRQRGKLPNLVVRAPIAVELGPKPDTARYKVRIGNTGRAIARGFDVSLRVNGGEVDARPIGRLRGGARRTIRFVGPACVTTVEAHIDRYDVVREITERDNLHESVCPPAQ